MGAFFHAVAVFFHHLRQVEWAPLGLALLCHIAKLLFRGRAWQNIIRAAYPGDRLKYRSALGAYVAGVGVNSIAPARGGDLIKLYLVKHRMSEATYPTLASTLVVETMFDFVVAGALMIWALSIGVLPTHQVYSRIPTVDWKFFLRHEQATVIGLAAIAFVMVVLALWARRRVEDFWGRVRLGFAILGDRRKFVLGVIVPQAISWVFRIATVFFFLRAFRVDATVHNALLAQVVESLATLVPRHARRCGDEAGADRLPVPALGDLEDAPARVQRRHEHRDHDHEPRARPRRDRVDGPDALVQRASPPGRHRRAARGDVVRIRIGLPARDGQSGGARVHLRGARRRRDRRDRARAVRPLSGARHCHRARRCAARRCRHAADRGRRRGSPASARRARALARRLLRLDARTCARARRARARRSGARSRRRRRNGRRSAARRSRPSSRRRSGPRSPASSTAAPETSCSTARPAPARRRSTCRRAWRCSSAASARSCSFPRSRSRRRPSAAFGRASATGSRSSIPRSPRRSGATSASGS